jgi:hypothetical protein
VDGQFGTVLGVPVYESTVAPDGAVYVLPTLEGGRKMIVGSAPWTDEELREHAVRTVRTGLADVLRWLGEDPGPEPVHSLAVSHWSIMRTLRDPDHALDHYRRRWVMPMGRR